MKPALKLLLLAGLTAIGFSASGEDYPNRPIKLVVPFPPGANTDISARLIANHLAAAVKTSVYVDNRPGASGGVGAASVAKSVPDGYTLLLASGALTINPSIQKNSYNLQKDLRPIAMMAVTPLVLVTSKQSNITTFKEFQTVAKEKSTALNYSSAGNGSGSHFFTELLNIRMGTHTTHVPYRGSGPAISALLTGEVDYSVTSLGGALPFYKDGKVNVLAVAGDKASALFPDVKTTSEMGLDKYDASDWVGVMVPSATPPPVAKVLEEALHKISADPGFKEQMEMIGFTVDFRDSKVLAGKIAVDLAKWKDIARQARITAN